MVSDASGARRLTAQLRLVPLPDGTPVDLAVDRPNVVGRADDADVVVPDDIDNASRRHCEVEVVDDAVVVRDLSTNGTFVDERRIAGEGRAGNGAILRVGGARYRVEAMDADGRPITGPSHGRETRIDAPPPGSSTAARLQLTKEVKGLRRVVLIGAAVTAVLLGVLAILVWRSPDNGPSADETVSAAAEPSVVIVESVDPDATVLEQGSGWILDAERGLVVTNAHILKDDGLVRVRRSVSDEAKPAKIVAVAQCDDLALLQLDHRSGLRALEMGKPLRQGQHVISAGYPQTTGARYVYSVSSGTVTAETNSVDAPEWASGQARLPHVIQHGASISNGSSGGPLLDDRGRVVGVNAAATEGKGNFNYAISLEVVEVVVEQMREGTAPWWAGLQVADDESGVVTAAWVQPGSAAADLGLRRGDTVAKVDGKEVATLVDYCDALRDRDGTSTVKIAANGNTVDLELDPSPG